MMRTSRFAPCNLASLPPPRGQHPRSACLALGARSLACPCLALGAGGRGGGRNASVRPEVAGAIVSMAYDIEKPGVPSPVAYRPMHGRQRTCVKRSGQCTPPKGNARVARHEHDLRASTRMGTRLVGMTNEGELLINIVMLSEPKMLTGSGQNGTWRDCSLVSWDNTDKHATGGEAGSNPLVLLERNRVSPYYRPMRAGRPQGRLMEVRVEERGKSERRSVMDRIGIATLSRAKARPLPQGLSSRDCLQNLYRRESK